MLPLKILIFYFILLYLVYFLVSDLIYFLLLELLIQYEHIIVLVIF